MSRPGYKTSRLIGKRIVFRRGKRPQRRIRHIYAIRIYVIFRSGNRILQIIFSLILCHPGAFQIRAVSKPSAQLFHHFLRIPIVFRILPLVHMFPDHCLNRCLNFLFRPGRHMILSNPLITQFLFPGLYQSELIPNGTHGVRLQLHAIDWLRVGAAPVQINPSVIILKQIRIPKRNFSPDFLKWLCQGIFRPVERTVSCGGSADIQVLPDHSHIRRIIIYGYITQEIMPFPADKILAGIKTGRHGGKQIIAPFKKNHGRIGRLPVNPAQIPFSVPYPE